LIIRHTRFHYDYTAAYFDFAIDAAADYFTLLIIAFADIYIDYCHFFAI